MGYEAMWCGILSRLIEKLSIFAVNWYVIAAVVGVLLSRVGDVTAPILIDISYALWFLEATLVVLISLSAFISS